MANEKRTLDENGVLYLWNKVKSFVTSKLPTKISQLTNDSGFITSSDIPEGAAASTTVPKMNGTASVGTEMAFARGDHVHPSDTTKVDKVEGKGLSTNDYTTAEKEKLGGIDDNANNYTLQLMMRAPQRPQPPAPSSRRMTLRTASRPLPPPLPVTVSQMPTPRSRWTQSWPARLSTKAPRTPMPSCPPRATRKAMCGTSSTPTPSTA